MKASFTTDSIILILYIIIIVLKRWDIKDNPYQIKSSPVGKGKFL